MRFLRYSHVDTFVIIFRVMYITLSSATWLEIASPVSEVQ